MNIFSKYTLAFFKNANKGWLPVMMNIFNLDDDKEKFPNIFSNKNIELLKQFETELKQDVYQYFKVIYQVLSDTEKYYISLKKFASKDYSIQYFFHGFPIKLKNDIEFKLVLGIYYVGDEFMDKVFNTPHLVYTLYYDGSEKNNDTIAYKIRENINKKDEFININDNLDFYFDEYICAYSYGIELNTKTTAESVVEDIHSFLEEKLIDNLDDIVEIISSYKKK